MLKGDNRSRNQVWVGCDDVESVERYKSSYFLSNKRDAEGTNKC